MVHTLLVHLIVINVLAHINSSLHLVLILLVGMLSFIHVHLAHTRHF